MKHPIGVPAWYISAVIVAGVAVAAYSGLRPGQTSGGLEWLILVALTVASGWATLRIPAMPISFSISDTFNIAAALLFGPSAGAITAALDGLVLSARMDEQPALGRPRPVQHGGGHDRPLGGRAGVLRDRREPSRRSTARWPRCGCSRRCWLFGAIDFGLNSGIVAVAVSFERRVSILSIWREHLAGVWITYFGGIFAAMLVMLLARFSTLETLILIVPLPVILYVTFRHALGRATDQIDHLAQGQSRVCRRHRSARARRRRQG